MGLKHQKAQMTKQSTAIYQLFCRLRLLFGRSQKLLVTSKQTTALRLTRYFFFWINLTLWKSLLQMKVIKSRYQNCLTDEHLKYYLYLCLSNLSQSYSKICSVTNQLRNRKVSESHLYYGIFFCFKISVFNKRNSCTCLCLILRHCTFLYPVQLILKHRCFGRSPKISCL